MSKEKPKESKTYETDKEENELKEWKREKFIGVGFTEYKVGDKTLNLEELEKYIDEEKSKGVQFGTLNLDLRDFREHGSKEAAQIIEKGKIVARDTSVNGNYSFFVEYEGKYYELFITEPYSPVEYVYEISEIPENKYIAKTGSLEYEVLEKGKDIGYKKDEEGNWHFFGEIGGKIYEKIEKYHFIHGGKRLREIRFIDKYPEDMQPIKRTS